jgi:C4-dicarboxylate-specific signal transduction histidine kinase
MLGQLCERLRRDLPPGMAVCLDGEPGLTVLAEPERLRAALDALAENARDALSAKGGGTITVSARPLDGKLAALTVADNGPGMDRDLAAHAAEPFFTTKKVGQGLGLGLTVAEIFARRMGGRLELVTAPGRGTHVTLVLPTA